MPTITRESARQHCRTCFLKLNSEQTMHFQDEENLFPLADEEHDNKSIAIYIATNENLKLLMEQYIEKNNVVDWMLGTEFPQHVCLGCYNRLQGFDKFRKQALECSETLRTLFSEGGVTKVEIDEFVDEKEIPKENIYSMMLKDALMETETVVLMEHTDISTLVNCELQTPDPFSSENIALKEKRTKTKKAHKDIKASNENDDKDDVDSIGVCDNDNDHWSKANSSDDDNEDDEEDKPLSRLRSSTAAATATAAAMQKSQSHIIPPQPAQEEPPQRTKYRRRTKKEMEQVRKEQAERDAQRDKPRKKGTKNSYRCDQCNHSFAHKLTRDAHVRKVHEGSKRPYQCDRCDKTYTFFGGLWTHIREIHETEERSYPCAYAGCDKIYTSLIAMQKHRREKHLGLVSSKTYVCELCGTTFNQIANLKYHCRRKHPMETDADSTMKEESKERHICNICNKQFHSRYTLKYHVLQLHSSDMKFECNVCGRRMAKKFMLVQHMRIHTLDRLPCDQCSKQFIRKHELEAHVRAVHLKLKPYGCQYCPETFACRKTLRHHEYIHTGEKPYVCDICGQAYRQQTSLKTHRKSHDTMTPETLLAKNINRTLESFVGASGGGNVGVGAVGSNAGGEVGAVGQQLPRPPEQQQHPESQRQVEQIQELPRRLEQHQQQQPIEQIQH